jgi:proteasome lid subunit RPN8/RPN11
VRIARALLDRIVDHARREFPNECCGFVATRDGSATEVA